MSEKKKRKKSILAVFRKNKRKPEAEEAEPVAEEEVSEEPHFDEGYEDLFEDGIARRQEKRNRKASRKKMIGMITLILVMLAVVISQSPICAVKEIKVHNNNLFSDEYVISTCGVKPGSRLYNLPGFIIGKNIKKANPYIVDVKTEKHFPNKLIITVQENEPVLALPVGNEYIILDGEGKVVEKSVAPTLATAVYGLDVKSYKIGSIPKVDDKQGLKEILKLVTEINDAGLYFKMVEMPSAIAVQAYVTDTLSLYGDPVDIRKNVEGIKTVLYDLSLGGHDSGVIFIGQDGYATYSPR